MSAEINSADESVDLITDYAFDDESDGDYVGGITIRKNNFVINGNNHIIDARNKAGLFTIIGTNVTINNLILKNSNNCALNISGIVITSNVTFMNCNGNGDNGGAVYLLNSAYESCNDKFIDNYAKYGSAIYARASNVTVNNGVFENDERIYWSLIYGVNSILNVYDTTFANITSKYATAVYSLYGQAHIKKSKFHNLFANVTAGAVGLKVSFAKIEDCEFINVSASRNGGAVFVDLDVYEVNVLVNHTTFENCFSEFGGAYLQLSGQCLVVDSTFKNNFAFYDGGAVYISSSYDAAIVNSTFEGNRILIYDGYPTYGGAVFIDNSIASIEDSKFTNNSGANGSAVYLYDSQYTLNNLEFNGNGNPIYTFWDEDSCEVNNLFGSDYISDDVFNNIYYPDMVYGPGKQLVLVNGTLNITDLPSRFNLVDYNLVTPVKDQGSMASCWAFGIIGALESALLKATNCTYDFSENNLQNSMLIYSKYGSADLSETATSSLAYAYLLNWFGVLSQQDDEYDELGKISAYITTENDIHIQDIVFIPYQFGVAQSIEEVKKAIVEYGALMGILSFGATASDDEPSSYNEETFALYNPNPDPPNHAICVVGWDDNFSRDNFINKPEGDGAWIIKNSWGSEWGDNGYFYVSYYDQTLCPYDEFDFASAFVGVKIENTLQYNKNYQYDFIGIYDYLADEVVSTGINFYKAYEDDMIAAVGTYLMPDANYTIEIIVNDSVVYKQQGVSSFFGYHTIKLDNYVDIKQGEIFGAAITVDAYPAISLGSRVKYQKGVSVSYMGDYYSESESSVNCIKIYTLPESFSADKIVEYYSINKPLKVNVNKSNVEVTISFENKTLSNFTDENGVATFELPLMEHGTHMINVHYNGSVVVTTVKVVSTIDMPDEIDVGCNANANTTINFYQTDGSLLNSITIPIPNQIGTYNLSFINYVTGEVRNSTIKVVSRFMRNDDITIYYNAGGYIVRVVGDDANPVGEGEIITFEINGKTCEGETDHNGLAAVEIPLDLTMGTYTITATYKGETVKNTVTILQPLSSEKTVSVKLTDDALVLQASLIGEIPFINETVTFKLGSNTYAALTDERGIAQIILNRDVIENLKAGETYDVDISYYNDTIKTFLKVEQPILTSKETVTVKITDNKLVLEAFLKYDATPVKQAMITFKFNGKTYTAQTNEMGIAKITLNKKVIKKLKAGKTYAVEISYFKNSIKTSVKVLQPLKSKKTVTVKKSAKKMILRASLKYGKTPLKNKKIRFKFNGKTYSAKTNKKGIAKITIKKNVIKKLKRGKTYTVRISYLTDTIKTKVKVK